MWFGSWFFNWLGSWFTSGSTTVPEDISISAELDGSSELDVTDLPPSAGEELLNTAPAAFSREQELPPPTPEDDRCLEHSFLELPAPELPDANCGSGSPQPPPPPPPGPNVQPIFCLIYEDAEPGAKRQFSVEACYHPLTFPWDRPRGQTGFRPDVPFGEKIYATGFLPISNRGRGLYLGIPPPPFTNAWYMKIEMLIGYRNGSLQLAPSQPMAHLPPNHVYMSYPHYWLSLSPLVIESYRPFSAYTCATNTINGHGPESQGGFYSPNSPFYNNSFWSPASNSIKGSSIKLVFREVDPLFLFNNPPPT